MQIPEPLRTIRRTRRDVLKALFTLVFGGPVLVGGSALAAFLLFPLPTVVPEPTTGALAQTTRVLAADGSLIATFHAEFNREAIDLEQMPEHLWRAAIASEDARFFEHRGLDLRSIARAALADLRAGQTVQGGSTITQQYVKNAYIEKPRRSLLRKMREALYAAQVERSLTKQKILENYMNTVYLGKGAYGVEAGAKTYFGKHASQLTVSESALLIGLIPAPVRYSPYDNPQGAEDRRLFVIDRMQKLGYLDAAAADNARREKPKLAQLREEVLRYPWFVDAVRRYLIAQYGEAKVFNGGLEVKTTLDPAMQAQAEKAIAQTLDKPSDPYAALAAVDPKTGYVKALVGGRDYAEEKYNIAIQGRRQPGSAFKPYVLVAALENGISPKSTFNGPSRLCPKGWLSKDGCLTNYGSTGYGRLTLEQATLKSVNTVYAQVILKVGPAKVVDVCRRMGIPGPKWLPGKTVIEPVPALTLGTEEVTPLEMASALATLAARGVYREPKLVSQVKEGPKVLEKGPSEGRQVIEERIADTANKILEKVITSGTGKRANIGRPAAGKTGTAEDFRNAWFVGFTPDLSSAVWMGYREKNRPMHNIHGFRSVVGGSIPAQIWASFMKFALADVPPSEFPEPGKFVDNRFRLPYRPPPSPTPALEESPTTEPEPIPTESPSPTPAPAPIPTVSPS